MREQGAEALACLINYGWLTPSRHTDEIREILSKLTTTDWMPNVLSVIARRDWFSPLNYDREIRIILERATTNWDEGLLG